VRSERKTAQTVMTVWIAIAVAYTCGILDRFGIGGQALGFVRVLIYLTLFIIWIIKVKRTVQQQATRRYLLIAGALMVFWLYIRSIKLEFILSPAGMRACWYLYYLPMLFIPVAALLAALAGVVFGAGLAEAAVCAVLSYPVIRGLQKAGLLEPLKNYKK